jgi:hypothetical protein
MAFGKKQEVNTGGNGGGNISGEAWDVWNEYLWNKLDVTPTKNANGKEIKEYEAVGVLNYIQELGCQPQADASMKSKVAAPEDGEENSAEELAVMAERPSNYFKWHTSWDNGKEVTERHVCWPKEPEEELILAVDFGGDLMIDYSLHPAAGEGGAEDLKPFRIDYNGKDFKDKSKVGRNVRNEVHWKTGKFSDKDIKYKITAACGNIEEYQSDGHDLAHLVQATCNWTIVMTKNVNNGNTYYTTSIKDPAPVQDIKTRKDVYTAAEQIEDAKIDTPFCGILFHGGEYDEDQLKQMRGIWHNIAKQAIQFDKNEGTSRDGEWLKGMNYEDSDLAKACKKFKIGENTQGGGQAKAQPKPENKAPIKKEVKPEKIPEKVETYNEPGIDFDSDIPF